jgi:hypothetical protein
MGGHAEAQTGIYSLVATCKPCHTDSFAYLDLVAG